jgi:hypothetical protein
MRFLVRIAEQEAQPDQQVSPIREVGYTDIRVEKPAGTIPLGKVRDGVLGRPGPKVIDLPLSV